MELDSATAQKIGETHAGVEYLKTIVDSMNKRFDGLGCADNKAKIDELYAVHIERKESVKSAKAAIVKEFAKGLIILVLAIFGVKIAG
jgi:ferritin-like metal-binding protein YciE